VGFPLAEYLLDDGAGIIVTDIDKGKADRLQQRYGSDVVRYVSPDEIYTVEADIFSPCAMGGIITEKRIPQFRCKVILGSANNQLRAMSKEAEIALAKKVANAGDPLCGGLGAQQRWRHSRICIVAASGGGH